MTTSKSSSFRTVLFYFLIIGFSVGIFLIVNHYGVTNHHVAEVVQTASAAEAGSPLYHMLLALVVIICATRLGGELAKKISQPPVIGETIAGILLGPSLLGLLAPGVSAYVLPTSISPQLSIVAQIGIILYMFLVGLEIDLPSLRKSAHSTISISHASIVLPFMLGSILSLWLYDTYAPPQVNFTSFALFLGVSMSITAFPVLARILTDQNLHKTKLGTLALTCAAIDDVTAWCLLAFVVSFAKAELSSAFATIIWTLVYIVFMLKVVMPFITKKLSHSDENDGLTLMIILVAVLFSSMLTEFIGIHALFGAFLFGAIIPHENHVAQNLNYRLNDVIRSLFLPTFFAFTGMRTKISLISGPHDWILCGVIILVAIIGKFGGTLIAARFSGHSMKSSVGLGILMNTRGLVELIALNIGLDIGVISPRLFAMMVIMALVTTLMTGPALKLVKGFEQE